MMRKSKKGFEAGWNTIIYAALAVLLILALWFLFKTYSGKGVKDLFGISDDATRQAKGEQCTSFFTGSKCIKDASECEDGVVKQVKECLCCVKT